VPVLVDTTLLPVDERFDAWAEASLKVFEPISVRPGSRLPFSGKLVRHKLGPLQVLHLSADASAARRTRRLIEESDPENIELMLQLRGACAISQDGRSSLIAQGDLGCWHSSAPYVVASDAAFEILIVTCPSMLLARHADRFRRRTAQRIDGSVGVGHLVRQHLSTLGQVLEADACSENARGHLAEGLFDLIRALHAPDDAATTAPRRGSQRMRAQIDHYIDTNLARPDLSRATIARENFVSCSYLDRLYRADRIGVSATIRAKRLDRVRRDLADVTLAEQSIFAIASRWGFVTPSHFSRAFRAAYGRSATAYREAGSAARRDVGDHIGRRPRQLREPAQHAEQQHDALG
jgi:AraC-like DNA-binding protein